jgi:hypothetical protein
MVRDLARTAALPWRPDPDSGPGAAATAGNEGENW